RGSVGAGGRARRLRAGSRHRPRPDRPCRGAVARVLPQRAAAAACDRDHGGAHRFRRRRPYRRNGGGVPCLLSPRLPGRHGAVGRGLAAGGPERRRRLGRRGGRHVRRPRDASGRRRERADVRPICLTLEAFGPYLERQVVAFDAYVPYGLFLIHGPTGSGKSTLLDAIVYALFAARGVERVGTDFVSTLDPGAETAVSFEFEHHGVRYRVSRRPAQSRRKLRGDGLTQVPAEAELVDLTHDDVIATKTGDVTHAIEELLHTNVEQFRQTVLLPQGEFRKVVTDNVTRRAVLSRVFRTERFTRLTKRIRQKAKDLEGESA